MVLFAGEALLLRSGENFSVNYQRSSAVMIKSRDAEDSHSKIRLERKPQN
jgi:hypothetical protein